MKLLMKKRPLSQVVAVVQELNMKFEFTIEEMNGILAVLAKQPFEQVTTIIEKIRVQALAQMQPAPVVVPEDVQ